MNKQTRDTIYSKYGGKCAYCGQPIGNNFHCDHIVPRVAGGSDDISNLNPACARCNNWKMAMSIEQFRHDISKQVHRAREYSRNFRMAEKFGLVVETGSPVVFYFERCANA